VAILPPPKKMVIQPSLFGGWLNHPQKQIPRILASREFQISKNSDRDSTPVFAGVEPLQIKDF